jgi:hypothetical protein
MNKDFFVSKDIEIKRLEDSARIVALPLARKLLARTDTS